LFGLYPYRLTCQQFLSKCLRYLRLCPMRRCHSFPVCNLCFVSRACFRCFLSVSPLSVVEFPLVEWITACIRIFSSSSVSAPLSPHFYFLLFRFITSAHRCASSLVNNYSDPVFYCVSASSHSFPTMRAVRRHRIRSNCAWLDGRQLDGV